MVTMTKMTVKLPERHGWPAGPHPASIIMSQLSKIVPEPAVADITPREGPSATFLLHTDYVDAVLKHSGIGGVFYKETAGAAVARGDPGPAVRLQACRSQFLFWCRRERRFVSASLRASFS